MTTYSDKLKDPRWQDKRKQVINRANYKCALCDDYGLTLDVHHKKYTGEPWEAPLNDLVALCRNCHQIITFYPNTYYKAYRVSDMAILAVTGFRTGVLFEINQRVEKHADVDLEDDRFDFIFTKICKTPIL